MYSKYINILMKVPLFKNIPQADLAWLLNCLVPNVVTYDEAEFFSMGESEIPRVGIILDGEVDVVKENFAGNRVLLARLKCGEIFGGISAFSGRKQLAIIEPTKQTTILFIDANKIVGMCNELCSGHELLIRNMLEIISKKALSLNRKVEIISLKTIRERISSFLLQRYVQTGSLTFTINLKRFELADYLNTTRPSLSRELINMKDDGIIDFYRDSFQIVDLKKLKACLTEQ